jgi:phosphoribosylformylglycinamidine cyclo-ligase
VGGIDPAEMVHVFNMGLGMLVIVPAEQAAAAQALVPELAEVGEMVAGPAEVHIV